MCFHYYIIWEISEVVKLTNLIKLEIQKKLKTILFPKKF